MANGTQTIVVTTPLFSTDYAQVNREISEWNRRARSSFLTIQTELNRLQIEIGNFIPGAPTGIATSIAFGTVKVNQTVANPVVYLKTTVDAIVAGLQSQIDSLQSQIDTINAQAIPTYFFPNSGETPLFPVIVGKTGLFGSQRATNLIDGGWWTWNGNGWSTG